MMWKPGNSKMIRRYKVYHKDNPENFVNVRTLQTLTAVQVKEKACKNGLFSAEDITELRVTRERS